MTSGKSLNLAKPSLHHLECDEYNLERETLNHGPGFQQVPFLSLPPLSAVTTAPSHHGGSGPRDKSQQTAALQLGKRKDVGESWRLLKQAVV